jgi:hypothetical protein
VDVDDGFGEKVKFVNRKMNWGNVNCIKIIRRRKGK